MYPPPHDLSSFFGSATEAMAHEYGRIYGHAKKDPGTAGDQGEENWKALLERWLPPTYQVVTKGKILTASGELSPQIDVIVLDPYYPRALLNNKYYLDAGVVAAFECKTTLKAQHVTAAVQNAAAIQRSLQPRLGTPYHELHSPIIYGLLAHSHRWTGSNSKHAENVTKQLITKDRELAQHPRESLDLVCVADLGFWSLSREADIRRVNLAASSPELQPYAVRAQIPTVEVVSGDIVPTVHTAYMGSTLTADNKSRGFSPIGHFVSNLIMRIAWEDERLRALAWYFSRARLSGDGGGTGRPWAAQTVFSKPVFDQLFRLQRPQGQAMTVLWDYWSKGWG